MGQPTLHELPVTDGPVHKLADGKSDELHFKKLQLDVDITAGDTTLPAGVNLRGPGNFGQLSQTSTVDYVMVKAPPKK